MVTEYVVDPDGKFSEVVKKALSKCSDLSPAWYAIKKSWYQSNKAIFSLKGPGKYPPLGGFGYQQKVKGAPYTRGQRAEAQKRRRYGFDYPLLMASGRLYASLVMEGGESIAKYDAVSLTLGTKVPYAFYHQSLEPRKVLPFRPFLFIGAEQTAPDQINNRQEAWVDIITKVVNQSLKDSGFESA